MIRLTLMLFFLCLAGPILAQGFPPMNPIPVPTLQGEVPLKSGDRTKSDPTSPPESWLTLGGSRIVRNVGSASLTPVLPAPGKSTGAAIIIAPGGGFQMLSIDSEGFAVARWLADHGIAAFVLKYRTTTTAADTAGFRRAFSNMLGTAMASGGRAVFAVPPEAIADGQRALRLIRSHAADYQIDPRRVGFLGFSAGAMTVLAVTLANEPGAVPDFVAPIYPPLTGVTVPSDAPPMFVAIADDDPLFGNTGYGLIEAWHKARRPVELHVYEKGGHGFGLGQPGTTSTAWIEQFYTWLQVDGWLEARS
ncbi:MAG: alpha/beta hydrolase [Pseudomonadota bacterium]|jgi:acetyl esterase/lipase